MDAIKLLEQQHDEVAALLKDAVGEEDEDGKQDLFEEIADALAIHATIEEKVFYPAVRAHRTEEILLESLEEHLAIKRTLADMLDFDAANDLFDAKLKVLKEEVEHHVGEERSELFPKVKKLFDREQLEAIGQEMESMIADLEGTEPRYLVRGETAEAAPLP